MAVLVAGAVLAAGCGGEDPSPEDFAGLYSGSGSTRYTDSDGRTFTEDNARWTESLTPSLAGDRILFAGSCGLTAVVTGKDTFAVQATTCDLGSDADCHYTDRTLDGVGTLTNDGATLSLIFNGEWVQSNCVDPAYNETFKYRTNVTLKRR